MKHTLPWNVTGIPPEARDVARAAASREGATVGEWLTRRIMAQAENVPAASAPEPQDDSSKQQLRASADEAHPPSSSQSSEAAIRRIDDVFRTLTHRLEISERAQLEAQRAMSAAAGEINAATRDQAEAFQLIVARIDQVERQTDTAPLRDAVRGLHQGLSRLAEQIAKTTDDTSGRIAALSGNFEVLAGKMALTRDDSYHLGLALEEKIALLDQRAKDNEERLKRAEESMALVAKLAEDVAGLEERVNATEERMQQSLGRYLTSIEHSLDEIGERLERAESRPDSDSAIKEALLSLSTRVFDEETKGSVAGDHNTQRAANTIQTAILSDALGADAVCLVDAPAIGADLDMPHASEAPPLIHAPEAPPPITEIERARDLRLADLRMSPPPILHASTENYLAQARRAARSFPGDAGRVLERHIAARRDIPVRRRISHPTAMAFLVLLLIGAGFMVTRAVQRANLMALSSPTYIALNVPPSAPGEIQTSVSPPVGVAAASLFNFADGSSQAVAELAAKASGGDAKAAMTLGLKYANGDGVAVNDAQAAYWLRRAADAGEAVAQYRLGTFYEHGRGFPADPKQALRWYGEAAKAGNRRAMHNLAVLYADGSGTDKNFAKAARWFRNAAELGLMDSQFNLGVLYERGLGVKSSLADAYKWYSIAAEAGDTESQERVAAIMNQITPADRDVADRAAKAYKPRPIDVAANDG
jgi:localization factor PodJL